MKYIYMLLSVFIIASFTACGKQNALSAEDANLQIIYSKYTDSNGEVDENISIDDVLDIIYENNTIEGVKQAKMDDMEETFGFDMSIIDEYYVRYSSKNYGVADMFVIKTDEKYQQDIFEILTNIKEDKVAEYENYVIYDSLDIAKKAEIYTKGDYVIMIMIKNKDEAKGLIDSFLSVED